MSEIILLIGASGVGKSTLIHNAVEVFISTGRTVQLLGKDTTRRLRGSAEVNEMEAITDLEFSQRLNARTYCATYDRFGERYGLIYPPSEQADSVEIYLQTVPTETAIRLKHDLCYTGRVTVVLLSAPRKIVENRLLERGDRGTLDSIDARMLDYGRDRSGAADITLEASGSATTVCAEFFSKVIIEALHIM